MGPAGKDLVGKDLVGKVLAVADRSNPCLVVVGNNLRLVGDKRRTADPVGDTADCTRALGPMGLARPLARRSRREARR